MSLDWSSANHGGRSNNIRGVPIHGGHCVQYNLYGTLYQVSRKYVPPFGHETNSGQLELTTLFCDL